MFTDMQETNVKNINTSGKYNILIYNLFVFELNIQFNVFFFLIFIKHYINSIMLNYAWELDILAKIFCHGKHIFAAKKIIILMTVYFKISISILAFIIIIFILLCQ